MITIKKSPTADTRTCDYATTPKEVLLESSRNHIADVGKGLAFMSGKLTEAAAVHDYDKLTEIDWFHADFQTGFAKTGWWDNHRRIHRHHLSSPDGVPDDVNLVDVIEHEEAYCEIAARRCGDMTRIDPGNEPLLAIMKGDRTDGPQ